MTQSDGGDTAEASREGQSGGRGPSKPAAAKAPALASATVVILRDGVGGIEVFMVERRAEVAFAPGALVFPGGKVEPSDEAAVWKRLAPGLEEAHMRPYAVAAARETFEEAGLLLARRRGSAELLDAATASALVEAERDRLLAGEIEFASLLEREGLELASDLMVRFAHWITPTAQPKRFDTQFYLVAAPVSQVGAVDAGESSEGLWLPVREALAAGRKGERLLMPPTLLNLQRISMFGSVAEAVVGVRRFPIVPVMPEPVINEAGRHIRIPEEAGYGVTLIKVAGAKK